MADIFVGSVAVGVVPDARGWNTELRRQLIPSADAIGSEYGRTMGTKITEQMGKSGESSGGAFEETFRKRVKNALDAIPRDATGPLAELRAKLQAIADEKIINSDKAIKEILKIDAGLEEVKKKSKDIDVTFNTKEARAQLALLRQDVGKTASGPGGIQGLLGKIPLIGGMFGGGGVGAQGAGQAAQAAPAAGGLFSNPYVLGGAAIAGAAALPFLGQATGGLLTGGLGAGLAGIGAIGAFGLGQQTPAQVAAANQASQQASQKAIIAQDSLNKLRSTGKATAQQLQTAELSLATARTNATNAQKAATTAQQNEMTAGQAQVRQSFTDLKNQAIGDLSQIGQAFVPVMIDIAKTAGGVLKTLTPVFKTVMEVIRGPFDVFVDTILKAFTRPDVVKSIDDVATAFANILNAFTPDIPGIADSLAQAISRMADAIGKNPKAFANFLNFLFQIVIALIDAIAWLTVFANYLEKHWFPVIANIAKWIVKNWDWVGWFISPLIRVIVHWHQFEADIINIWNSIWNNTIGRAIRGGHDLEVIFNNIKSFLISWFNRLTTDVTNWWNIIWNNTIGRAIRGWHDLMNIFYRLKNDITGFFGSAFTWLEDAGKNIISGLYNGIKSAIAGVGNWVKTNIVDPVVQSVKHFFGIASPSTVMAGIGANIIKGLLHGMFSSGKDLTHFVKNVFGGMPAALGHMIEKGLVDLAHVPSAVLSKIGGAFKAVGGFFAKLFGGGTSGVKQWAGVVAQALSMLGLPLSLGSQVLYQMQTESGGNPNAINLTDINAQQGDPSRGLMQVIGSTFAAFHVPGTSNNIYDPLANIAAAINYARAVYGPTLMNAGMGIGSGHGYDQGGWLPPGVTLAYNLTGQHERILSPVESRAYADGGTQYHAHFDGLTGQTIEGHVRTAFTAMSIQQGALQRQGRRR